MTQKDVDKALDNRMGEYILAYPIAVDYPTIAYEPVVGTPYLKIDYLHGTTAQVELGTESSDRATGIYQITLNISNNNGSAEETLLISQLKEYFKRGTVSIYNDLNVRITSFYLGGYTSEADWYRRIINVVFRADIGN